MTVVAADERRKIMLNPKHSESLFEADPGHCCWLGEGASELAIECNRDPEYLIRDLAARDPYDPILEACPNHVGHLLTNEVEISPEVDRRWEVIPSQVECKACALKLPNVPDILDYHSRLAQRQSDGSRGTCAEFWERTYPHGD